MFVCLFNEKYNSGTNEINPILVRNIYINNNDNNYFNNDNNNYNNDNYNNSNSNYNNNYIIISPMHVILYGAIVYSNL